MQAITKVFSDIIKPYIDSENQTLANEVTENWSDNKNLLPPILYNNAASITYIGVTLTIDDLKFKITGTASGDGGRLNLRTDPFMLKAGTYTVSGVIGAATAVHKTSDNSVIISRVTPNEDATFTLETDTSVFVGINVTNGITYNQTVGLQIEKGSSATPYQPYAKSNKELTKDDSGLTANAFANGAVNLLENKATSQVINGITWVVNSDGTITASGTATDNSFVRVANINNPDLTLDKGIYRFVACPLGGSTSNYYAYITDGQTQSKDYGNGVEFNVINDNTDFAVILYVINGQTVNITFKPMITVADMPNSDYDHYVPYAKSNSELTDDVNNLIIPVSLTIDSVSIPGNSVADIKLNDLTAINVSDQIPSGFKLGAVIFSWSTGHSCVPTQCYVSSANNYRSFALSLYNISSNNITVNAIDVVLICKRA